MSSIINPTLRPPTSEKLCYYFNSSNQMQIIRLWDGRNYSLEKIIFPQQRILFEATSGGILEVHTKQRNKQLLLEIFPCSHLQVKQSQLQLAAI